jgi:hypothetical protein
MTLAQRAWLWFYPCKSDPAMTAAEIGAWEDEGGSAPALPAASLTPPPQLALSGTPSQVEWAERIRIQVQAEFNRVAASFRSVAGKQDLRKRADTESIIAIVEDLRADVMSRQQAGYFIREWQEIDDQVRQMIFLDPRYQAIKYNWSIPKTTLGRQAAL